MRIDVLTLFPDIFPPVLEASVLGRALNSGVASVLIHDIRDYAHDRHSMVDDYPYGGGPGMVMKPEPLAEAIDDVRSKEPDTPARVILLTPQGRRLDQAIVSELAAEDRIVLVCGHYEGVDERIREHLVDDEISIGDYVLSGGEIAALVVIDAVVRHLPGALAADSLAEESHSDGLLEYPQYTRPAEFRGWRVPDILLSGNHGEIARWRRLQRIIRTARRRPDLLATACLTDEERRLAAQELADAGEQE